RPTRPAPPRTASGWARRRAPSSPVGGVQPGGGCLHSGRCHREQQVTDGRIAGHAAGVELAGLLARRVPLRWNHADSTSARARGAGGAARGSRRATGGRGGASWTPPPSRLPGRAAPRIPPTNCLITPRPPLTATVPDCGARSPAMSRISVVLPAPFGPTRAAV